MKLRGQVAIVTGAGGRGCGRAVARRFAAEGARVIVNDVDEDGARATQRSIEEAGGEARCFPGDVGIEANARALVAMAKSAFGDLHVLVNNASGRLEPEDPLDGWFETIRVDLLGPMYATRFAVATMRDGKHGGAIVNIGSTSALGHGFDHSPWPAYDVAKAAVMRLTTALGGLHARYGIRVNCLVPGWIASPGPLEYWESLTPQERRLRGVPETLLGLDEVAGAVLRLASDATLAGRLLVYRNDAAPMLVAERDPGYERLDPVVGDLPPFEAFDHVQLALPQGGENRAREFYVGALGMTEIPKPAELAARGGAWFCSGSLQLHLGVETDFRPARKAHPALRCTAFDSLVARLDRTGYPVTRAGAFEDGKEHAYVDDPFANRIELIGATPTSVSRRSNSA